VDGTYLATRRGKELLRDSREDEDRRRRGDEKQGNRDNFSGYIRRGFHRARKEETREGLGARGREGGRAGHARATEKFVMASLLQVRKYGSARLEDSKLPRIASSFDELLEDVFCGFAK